MYAIVVYDTQSKNCSKLYKTLKRFLNWNQNSAFEGELTEAQLFDIKKLLQKKRAAGFSIILYELKDGKNLKKTILGKQKGNSSNIFSNNAPTVVDGILNID
jgi:CRISPR-associated protein Cas2